MIPLDRLIAVSTDRVWLSPNFDSRGGMPIRLIVLHATGGGSEEGSLSWMADPTSEVSCHLLIHRDGSVTRVVADQHRAWHAGKDARWPGIEGVNSHSLGWEIANRNDGIEPYTDAQYATVALLLRHYLPQGIDRKNVVGHSDVAPGRKTDPIGWQWSRMWREYEAGSRLTIPAPSGELAVPEPILCATREPPRLDHIEVPAPKRSRRHSPPDGG